MIITGAPDARHLSSPADGNEDSATTSSDAAPLTRPADAWKRILVAAAAVERRYAEGRPVDPETVASLARAILLFQTRLLGSFGRGRGPR
jgi:hypothetical protein